MKNAGSDVPARSGTFPGTPHAFVMVLRPKDRAVPAEIPAPALPFHLAFETLDYRGDLYYAEHDRLSTDSGDCCILLGGAIYRPQSADISQTLLALYARQGANFVRDLDGDFALLLIDRRAHQIILAERLHVPDIRAFTYAYGSPQPMTDEALAPALTTHYGGKHRVIQSFDGLVVETLMAIAQLGQGLTDISDETDTWLTLGSEVGDGVRPLLFTGDLIITRDLNVTSTDDALTIAKMFDFTVARWLEPLIGRPCYDQWAAETQAEQESALRQLPPMADYYILLDMLRVYARLPQVFSTWRRNFAGRFFDVVNPLMDANVVEIFMKTPFVLQRDKTLYHQTVQAMFPELFALPRAKTGNYATYWIKAFKEQAGDVRAWVQSTSSPLDELIEPDVLLTLLDSDRQSYGRAYTAFRSKVQSTYRWFNRVSGIQPGFARPSLIKKIVPAHRLSSRSLVLRSFLRSAQLRQMG